MIYERLDRAVLALCGVFVLFACSTHKCDRERGSTRQITLDTNALLYENFRGKRYSDIVRIPCDERGGLVNARLMSVEDRKEILVHYIHWNGLQVPKTRIDSLRGLVERKIAEGIPFDTLVPRYTMDGNPTGALGWIDCSKLVPEFTNTVLSHHKGDLFRVDVNEKQWFYVVRMDEEPRVRRTFTVAITR